MKKDKEEKVNLEEKVEELEKSNKWMKGILLSLVLVFFMVICIYAGVVIGKSMNDGNKEKTDKNDVKVEEENKEEEIELEQLTKDSKVVKELFEVFREDVEAKQGLWNEKEYSDFEKKMYIAYLSIDDNNFTEKKCGNLDSTYAFDKTGFIYHCGFNFSDNASKYYADENWEKFGEELVENSVKTISADKLREVYEKIYGKKDTYQDETFSLVYNTMLYYDASNKVYARFSCQCGRELGQITPQNLDDITQKDNTLILHTSFNYFDGVRKVDYVFEYEKETGNYIFVSRESK
ncbi:MAG: hypothetical protein IJN90_08210 [Bacilli bacterium]|nr:hypothetical protein [Bacilli bacterium]